MKGRKWSEFKFRVNVIHKGKERFKYARTLIRARYLRDTMGTANGLSSVIFDRRENKIIE